MKTFPMILSISMLVSWGLGIYFISIVNTPTIIIPLFDHFLWMDHYQGFLGLTLLFSITTIPLVLYAFQKRGELIKKKSWYSLFTASQLFWLATMAAQTKIIAYNLGICH